MCMRILCVLRGCVGGRLGRVGVGGGLGRWGMGGGGSEMGLEGFGAVFVDVVPSLYVENNETATLRFGTVT